MKKEEIKILLVDDEPDIIEIIQFNLNSEGYQIFTANDGLEAIKLAEKHMPNLIIMDVMMPNMDGIEACENLRKDNRFNDWIKPFLLRIVPILNDFKKDLYIKIKIKAMINFE